ncbi:hypothetical protein MXB_4483, partial [Myxobolus squamalis]
GQLLFLRKTKYGPILVELRDSEQEHLDIMHDLIKKYGTRKSYLQPLWWSMGWGLGMFSGITGYKTAMAATIAIEEVIMNHYAEQIIELEELDKEAFADLIKIISKTRDDEIHHRDTGVLYQGREIRMYGAYSAVVKTMTKLAVSIAEKI